MMRTMLWTLPQVRTLALAVVVATVALGLLAVRAGRQASLGSPAPAASAPTADATPGSTAHARLAYRRNLER